MKKTPQPLLDHLAQTATTYCTLIKIVCQGRWQGTVLGLSNLDENLAYDDGLGVVNYLASNPFSLDRIETFSDLGSVGNSDIHGWVDDSGITTEQILSGIFDYAEVTIYRVNYLDLSMGHEVVAFGTCGQTKFTNNKWTVEFRSLSQQARQMLTKVYSKTCRAEFGDSKCRMPFVWASAEVLSVGEDNTKEFSATSMAQADNWFNGGVLEWITGNNAGSQIEVTKFEESGADRDFTLLLPMPLVIEAGDQFRVRQDCGKTFADCKAYGNELNFRGEHLTPVGDTALMVPGANIERV